MDTESQGFEVLTVATPKDGHVQDGINGVQVGEARNCARSFFAWRCKGCMADVGCDVHGLPATGDAALMGCLNPLCGDKGEAIRVSFKDEEELKIFLESQETKDSNLHTLRRSSYSWSRSLRRHLKRHDKLHVARRRRVGREGVWEWRVSDDAMPPPSLYAIVYRPEETPVLLPHNPLQQLPSGCSTSRNFLIWSRAQGKPDDLLGEVSIPGDLSPHEVKLLISTELAVRGDFLLEVEDGTQVDTCGSTLFNPNVRRGEDSLYLVKLRPNTPAGRSQTQTG
mmetsp:Transcript_39727/g.124786  ORF Transcript_39727/g.124786 Transcript_39727/m.124786 type:complete len:281 (+) Transcript_39727:87-929(+)